MGSGFRTFTAGEVLTASNVQNYLMDQSVMVFGGSAARSSAIGTANFEEGMVSYLTDTDKVEAYNGTNWVSVAPTSTQGLTLLQSVTFSGAVSSQSLNNVFDATYTNYRIIIKINAFSTADVFKMRFRVSGADNTTSDYRYMGSNQLDPWTNTTYGNTFWVIHRYQRANGMHFVADIFNPFATNYTTMLSSSAQVGQDPGVNTFGGGFIATTSFTGFTIFPDGGTMSDGTIKVYGYQE